MNRYAPPKARVSDPPHDDRPSVFVTQLLALIFGGLALLSSWNLLYQRAALPSFVLAVLCGVASLGLWRVRPWSRWVVYLFSTLLCSYSAWYVAYESTRSVASLLPGSMFVLFGVAAAIYVARVFRQ